MIAADTSAILHFLHGFDSIARVRVREALADEDLVLPAVVVTELLSGVHREDALALLIAESTRLPVVDGYWERTGESRRTLKALGLKANLADALVAQACIDADTALISGDSDFRHFAAHCGLRLV